MASPEALSEGGDAKEGWEPEAWVYFIWIVFGNRLYCKIGYSIDPISRYHQLIAGMPEQPFRIHLLSCLSVEQAKLFESMLHDHLHFCEPVENGFRIPMPNIFPRFSKVNWMRLLGFFTHSVMNPSLKGLNWMVIDLYSIKMVIFLM